MARPSRLVLAALAIGGLLLVLAASPAVADHVYSHRYLVIGRVIDSLGQPAMSWSASATFSGVTPESLCQGFPPLSVPDTTASGDFFLCYHVHAISTGTVTVSGPGFSRTLPLNADLRRTFVLVRLETEWPTKDSTTVGTFHENYYVLGRVWQPQPGTNLEGIPVSGLTLPNEPVSVKIAFNSGKEHTGPATTNGYGDYVHLIPLGESLSTGTLTVTTHGQSVVRSVDPEFMVSDLDVILQEPANPLLAFLANYYWAIIAPAAAVVVLWYLFTHVQPRRAARDVSRIPGIGRAKAQSLRDAGVRTIDQLAASSPKELADATHLPTKETKRLVRKAKEFQATEDGEATSDDGDED